ncbi:MAG: PEP-CTERM sorting domain-containing protein [Proteobacteria bacterium]|nr:PEP-CTERM sorting domain-containing protein [Pseudomonadota bacterium]MBU1545263.1 PEP-CTERM sorting domain-containing protein [Pseudomonadota bacterium]
MINKRKILWFALCCLGYLAFAGSAVAMPTAASAYRWTGIDNGTFYVQNQYVSGLSFGVYSWENGGSLQLFAAYDDNLNRTMDVYGIDPLSFEIDATKLFKVGRRYVAETETLALGASPEFGFYFSDGSTFSNSYALAGNASSGWDLSHGDMTVHVFGDVSPSPVPLPASLLLLGSGLLGMLGLGRVQKKSCCIA